MKFSIKIAVLLAAIALVLSFSALATDAQDQTKAVTFSDITAEMSYAEDVYKLAEAGVLNGFEDGTFRPEGGVTRAQMCKMVVLTFKLTADNATVTSFPDVTSTDWYAPYALIAKANGVVEGFEDGTFRGSELITREQVCAILNRIIKPYDLPIEVTVTDKVSDWAMPHVVAILKNGIMPMEKDNTFRATEVVKRYELATALSKFAIDAPEMLTADVRFFSENEQIGETDTIIIGEFATVPENPVSSDESLEFAGWRVVGTTELVNPVSYYINENTDFEAVFVTKTFKVNFYDGANKLNTTDITVDYGALRPAFVNPEKTGYTFNGWSLTNGGELVDDNYAIKKDTDFYAIFTKKPEITYCSVKFMNGEEVFDTQSVAKGSCAKVPTTEPELDGYKFIGWVLDPDDPEIITVSKHKIDVDTIFYAGFEEVIVTNPNDPEFVNNLYLAYEQFEAILFTDPELQELSWMVLDAMDFVIADVEANIFVDKAYIEENYGTELTDIENYVLDELSVRQVEAFLNSVTDDQNGVDKEVQDFLLEYFLPGQTLEDIKNKYLS